MLIIYYSKKCCLMLDRARALIYASSVECSFGYRMPCWNGIPDRIVGCVIYCVGDWADDASRYR